MGMFLIVYGIEITSCFNNYFEYKGLNKRINFFKLIGKKDIQDVLEEPPKSEKEDDKGKTTDR